MAISRYFLRKVINVEEAHEVCRDRNGLLLSLPFARRIRRKFMELIYFNLMVYAENKNIILRLQYNVTISLFNAYSYLYAHLFPVGTGREISRFAPIFTYLMCFSNFHYSFYSCSPVPCASVSKKI